eukprot:9860943-Lingulodinium_polyedra.AAC.1
MTSTSRDSRLTPGESGKNGGASFLHQVAAQVPAVDGVGTCRGRNPSDLYAMATPPADSSGASPRAAW